MTLNDRKNSFVVHQKHKTTMKMTHAFLFASNQQQKETFFSVKIVANLFKQQQIKIIFTVPLQLQFKVLIDISDKLLSFQEGSSLTRQDKRPK